MERVNKTLQDRLIKEMRLEGIDTMEHANRYLPTFIEQFNAKFGKEAANPTDLHRSLTELAKELQRKKVRVYDYPDGTVAIKYAR